MSWKYPMQDRHPLSFSLYKYDTLASAMTNEQTTMESRRPKHQQMGRSKPNAVCKKHPKHQQSPGVCSICLKEKLSQLCKSSRGHTIAVATSCSSSSLSSLSSHYSSSCSSPVHRRMASEARGMSSTIFFTAGINMLSKSRSVAAATRRREGEGLDLGKKKSNFWSKLLRPKAKRIDEGLIHSKTMREMLATRVH